MANTRATARIIADVNPEVKEKLVALSNKTGKSMTEILSILINAEYSDKFIK